MTTTDELKPTAALVGLLAELAKNDDVTYTTISYADLVGDYANVKTAIDATLEDRGASAGDIVGLIRGSYFDDERTFYLVDVHVGTPEGYNATLAFWEDRLIGENGVVGPVPSK